MSVSGTTSTSTSSAASLVVNGLVSGIDTPQVIQALLQSYSTPITDVEDQQTSLNSQASDYKTINTDLQAVLSAAQALSTPSSWNLMDATTSNSSVATASSSPGAQPGTLAFTVNALAQGNVEISAGGVSSVNTNVTSSPSVLLATGGAAIGFQSLAAGSGLGLGAHTISVTQSSSAAQLQGATPLGASTNIPDGDNDLDVSVNGTSYTLSIPTGSYTPSQLVTEINSAAAGENAPITASLSSSGALTLSTNEQGSAATLQLTGGGALSELGLSAGAVTQGTNAVVNVDGTATTLSSITAGGVVNLNAPSGTITATIASAPNAAGALVAAGSASSALVSTGNGSLSSLVSAINSSGLGLSATAVQDASGEYRLQLSANGTGLAGEASIDSSVLSAGPLASMSTIATAQDASVSVGGAGGYTVTSSSNTFSNLMSGTAITVASTGQVTTTVAPNASGEATQVAALVTAANQTLSDISSLTAYNSATKTGGPLMGSAVVEGIENSLESIFASVSGTSGLGNSSDVGITLQSNGSLSFNQQAFETAFAANPSQVASLFTQGGQFNAGNPQYDGQVSLLYAGNQSATGSYDVSISQSAAVATDTGTSIPSGIVSAPETLTIGSSGVSTTYEVSSGQSLSSIVAGLNDAFGAAGLDLSAQLADGGTALQVTSDAYGSGAEFTVSSSAPGAGTTGLGDTEADEAASFSGTDVAGTINGVASTGAGQVLTAPTDDPTLNGMSLLVTAPGISSNTDLGTYKYLPGLAQQLVSLSDGASNASTGSVTSTINGLTAEATGLNTQLSSLEQLETNQQTVLQNEFATMETTLGQLKNESSSLTSAISGLTTF